jgi:hypothetical protein
MVLRDQPVYKACFEERIDAITPHNVDTACVFRVQCPRKIELVHSGRLEIWQLMP